MKKAFTLAEVLITLMIIGIVAALTIPSVISNYQQQEFKTGLKKAVSVLNEAIQTNIIQEGKTPYEIQDYQSIDGGLAGYLSKHMSVIKDVNSSVYIATCYDSNGALQKSDGGFCSNPYNGWRDDYPMIDRNKTFYTTDGMRYEVATQYATNKKRNLKLHESGLDLIEASIVDWNNIPVTQPNVICGSYGLAENPNKTTAPPCLVLVDVNGDRKPSAPVGTISRLDGNPTNATSVYQFPSPTDKKLTDVFNILITDEKAIPFGVVAQRAMYSK